jgi:hypothetical protein
VPLTKKLSAEDAVAANVAYDAEIAFAVFVANDALVAVEALSAYDALSAYEDEAATCTYEAVFACKARDAEVALFAQLAVPDRDPVTPFTTIREFKLASEPDTMTFFQFGILICSQLYTAVRYIHLCRVYAYFPFGPTWLWV